MSNEQRALPEYFKCGKITWRSGCRGSAPDPAGRANYSAAPDPLAGRKGAGCPVLKNPIPALGPSGLEPRGLRPLFSRPLSSSEDFMYHIRTTLSLFCCPCGEEVVLRVSFVRRNCSRHLNFFANFASACNFCTNLGKFVTLRSAIFRKICKFCNLRAICAKCVQF